MRFQSENSAFKLDVQPKAETRLRSRRMIATEKVERAIRMIIGYHVIARRDRTSF